MSPDSSPLRRGFVPSPAGMVIGGAMLAAAVVLVSATCQNQGDALTRNTIRLSLAWYAVAVGGMLWLDVAGWNAASPAGQFVRLAWTWSIVCFLIHLAMAFHYFHHWSHAHAYEHTQAVSGWGAGLFVSYTFTALWTLDAAWWWLAPRGYAERDTWIGRVLHVFMAFIVFNGTVIYESGLIRWAGILAFAVLAVMWLNARVVASNAAASR